MVRVLSFALLALSAVFASSVAGQADNDNPNGKVLYVNYPSCGYYRCSVTWKRGQRVYINWLNAPKGGLKIEFGPQEGVTGLPTYTVTKKTGGTHDADRCDKAGTKESCGRYYWTLPDNIKPGQYQIIVTSLANPNIVGYTDTVVVPKKAASKSKRHDPSRLDADEDDEDEE